MRIGNNIKDNLYLNILANFGGNIWASLMAVAFIPIYIKILGIEAWGLIGFMTVLQGMMSILDFGLSPSLNKEMARYLAEPGRLIYLRNLLRTLEYLYVAIALLIIILIASLSVWISTSWLKPSTIPNQEINTCINLMGCVISARIIEQLYRGALQGLQQHFWLNSIQFILVTFRWGGAALILLYVSPKIELFFLWQAFTSFMSACVFGGGVYAALPCKKKAVFDKNVLKDISGFAGHMALITILVLLLTQFDKLLLSRFLDLKDFGFYILANSISSMIPLLVTPVSIVTLPRLTQLFNQSAREDFEKVYHQGTQIAAVALIPASTIIIIFSNLIIYVWTGNESLAESAGPLLALLAAGTMINGLMHVPYSAQLAHGWTSLTLYTNLFSVVLLVPLLLVAIFYYGAPGAALSMFMMYLFSGLIVILSMHRKILRGGLSYWFKYSCILPIIICMSLAIAYKFIFPVEKEVKYIIFNFALLYFLMLIVVFLILPELRVILKKFWGVFLVGGADGK